MAYEKRLCVLKQIKKGFSADGAELSGAVYAERLGSTLTITLKLPGIAPLKEGRYALAVRVGKKDYLFDLTEERIFRGEGCPSLADGFSALLCFVREKAEPIASGGCGKAVADSQSLLSVFSEVSGKNQSSGKEKVSGKEGKKKIFFPPAVVPGGVPTQTPGIPVVPGIPIVPIDPDIPDGEEEKDCKREYFDEAIAEDNYYLREEENERKGDADADAAVCGQGQGEKETSGRGARSDAQDGTVEPFLRGGPLTYYNEVREKLAEAFEKYPRDQRLNGIFPCSEWVNTGSSLLGIVYLGGRPQFLCVAVEAHGAPPEEIKESCVFVPANHYSDSEGFYIVFQSAETGETVKTYDA